MMPGWLLSPLARARRAARARDWARAAAAYRRHLARHPLDAAAWMQLGHNVKATGDLAAAAAAYREAVRIAPDVADSWIHLAHLERGDRETAIAALERAIAADGGSTAAVAAFLALGARDRLPLSVQQRIEVEEGTFAPSRYAAWIADRPVARPAPAPGVMVVIDGRGAEDAAIAATRTTLGDLAVIVLGRDAGEGDAPPACPLLLLEAGARIAPDATARLLAAVAETGAGAAYCDHDHWEEGSVRRDPVLQPMFDPVWFARAAVRPPCLLLAAGVERPATWAALFHQRLALPLPYAHVPLLLASRRAGTVSAEVAPLSADQPGEGPIQVIVQTRDAPDMLRACIETLRVAADRPELLDIVIVDNRSVLPRTAALLASWEREGIARVIAHDAPFNWALANNLAADTGAEGQGRAAHLLFLNNDVEMESAGWDTALREGLATEGVGALGALLLYPDGTIQHGGVVFGVGEGGPLHEGIGHLPDPGGPCARWRHPRMAAAVTGAWLAVSRALFDDVGGFEERLPVGYNDIDFCLRVRAAGKAVVQASHIVAIHRESATRGIIMSPEAQARDEAEWAWMRVRWGAALTLDPACNPHWSRKGRPFDGIATPSDAAVARWVAASAQAWPWGVGEGA